MDDANEQAVSSCEYVCDVIAGQMRKVQMEKRDADLASPFSGSLSHLCPARPFPHPTPAWMGVESATYSSTMRLA